MVAHDEPRVEAFIDKEVQQSSVYVSFKHAVPLLRTPVRRDPHDERAVVRRRATARDQILYAPVIMLWSPGWQLSSHCICRPQMLERACGMWLGAISLVWLTSLYI